MVKAYILFGRTSFKQKLYFCPMLKKLALLLPVLALSSCGKEAMPKPLGELRLEYPKASYQKFDAPCGFSFDYSTLAKVEEGKEPCWYYVVYPELKAKLFVTYMPIQGDVTNHIKEAERLVYKHTIKASAIDTKSFEYPERKVYGNFYELKGQTASNIQFYVTDSTKNFLTANLYFNSRPKPDSLAPAIDYVKKDLKHMLDTFEWK